MTEAVNLYPTTFSEDLEALDSYELDAAGQQALGALAVAGFNVEIGARRSDVAAIAEVANQEPVREFCPKDSSTRFGDESKMEQWLAKGRGMVLLRERETGVLAGYGWTGPDQNQHLPDAETTFAIRLNEHMAGRGLAKYFTAAIVSGAAAVYGARKIGLETWKSNQAAVRSYERAGAQLVVEREDMRLTLQGLDKTVPDTRLYMQFTNTF